MLPQEWHNVALRLSAVIVSVVALAGCGGVRTVTLPEASSATKPTAGSVRTVTVPRAASATSPAPADPAGYPVECDVYTSCYQLGRLVDFDPGGRITAAETQACRFYGQNQNPRRDHYVWVTLSDPAPGAGPTASTYVCGPPSTNLSQQP